MQPLNQPERRKAFFSFISFFIITTAFIVVAILFSVQVPAKENQQLRTYKETVEQQKILEERFIQNVNITSSLIDSLDKPNVNPSMIDGKIGDKLSQMDAMVAEEQTSSKELYHNIIENISRLHLAKKELREALQKDAGMGELRQELQDKRMEVKMLQNELLICRTMNQK